MQYMYTVFTTKICNFIVSYDHADILIVDYLFSQSVPLE